MLTVVRVAILQEYRMWHIVSICASRNMQSIYLLKYNVTSTVCLAALILVSARVVLQIVEHAAFLHPRSGNDPDTRH